MGLGHETGGLPGKMAVSGAWSAGSVAAAGGEGVAHEAQKILDAWSVTSISNNTGRTKQCSEHPWQLRSYRPGSDNGED